MKRLVVTKLSQPIMAQENHAKFSARCFRDIYLQLFLSDLKKPSVICMATKQKRA